MARIVTVDGKTPEIDPGAFVAEGVTIAGDVRLAAGANVWFGTVIRGDYSGVTIGRDSNLQDLTVVHTDDEFPTIVGDRVTVGHRALLHGCTIEDDALIGMGAVLLNGVVIGAGAVVAAGAVVKEGTIVPPGTLAVGVPAKVLERPVAPVPRPNVGHYLALAEQYRAAGCDAGPGGVVAHAAP